MRYILTVLAVLGVAASANAQVVNPTVVTWDHIDFSNSTGYEFGYFADATTPSPIQTQTVAKPGTCSPCTNPFVLPSKPLGFAVFYLGVRAQAGTAVSNWSARVPFELRLSAPTNLSVK